MEFLGIDVDMNDPASLSLYSELVRFQVDHSKQEVRFSYPGNEMQRILQSFAHGLGLEYEYFLGSREARITRATALTGEPVLGPCLPVAWRRGSENISGGSSHIYTNKTSDQQQAFMSAPTDNSGPSFEHDCLDLSMDELPDAIFNFDRDSNTFEPHVEEPDILTSLLHETILGPSELPNGQCLLHYCEEFHNSVGQGCAQKTVSQAESQIRDGFVNSNCSREGICHELASSSAIENYQLGFSPISITLSSTTKDEDLSSSFSDASLFSSRRAGSRSSSISSIQSSRGQGKVSKMSSKRLCDRRQDNSAGFQEFTFNSRPSRTLASSGRHGPLNAIAKAAMNAVTAAGACWRCKFLRKSCDTKDPCEACPRSSIQSHWSSVGCKRGTLESKMSPILLCPQAASGSSVRPSGSANQKTEILCIRANGFSQQIRKRRPEHIPANVGLVFENHAGLDLFLESLINRWSVLENCLDKRISSLDHRSQEMLIPLDECILTILWEAFDCPLSQNTIGNIGDALILMRAATLYQAKTGTDQLIPQSLVCLRSCLEALRLKYSGFLDIISHRTCGPSICKIDCIAHLTSALAKYLAELSSVLFKKENMRSKVWRLSIFYSFCIQSIVRKALINLVGIGGSIDACLGAKQYLHLAVRLFIASSGIHDPLMRSFSAEPENLPDDEASRVEDYRLAQYASQQKKWSSIGVTSSANYLKYIFEDDGNDIGSELRALDAEVETSGEENDNESATSAFKESALQRIMSIRS